MQKGALPTENPQAYVEEIASLKATVATFSSCFVLYVVSAANWFLRLFPLPPGTLCRSQPARRAASLIHLLFPAMNTSTLAVLWRSKNPCSTRRFIAPLTERSLIEHFSAMMPWLIVIFCPFFCQKIAIVMPTNLSDHFKSEHDNIAL